MILSTVDLNGTNIAVAIEKFPYSGNDYKVEPLDAAPFIVIKIDKAYSILDDINTEGINLARHYKMTIEDIYASFKTNKYKLPEDKLKKYFITYFICKHSQNIPKNMDYKIHINDIDFTLNPTSNIRLWRISDTTGLTDKEYLDKMKIAIKSTTKYYRNDLFDIALKDFTDPKVQKMFLTFVKSLKYNDIYDRYYIKYNNCTDKEIFKLYFDQSEYIKAWNLYWKLSDNLQRLYHPNMITMLPTFIHQLSVEKIQTLEAIEKIEWGWFDAEPLKPEYLCPGGILPRLSGEKLEYVLDKIKVINNLEWIRDILRTELKVKGLTPEFIVFSQKLYEKMRKDV